MTALRTLAVAAFVAAISVSYGPPALAQGATPVIVVLVDGADPLATARDHAARFGAVVEHVYGAALNGYAARVPASGLAALRAEASVLFVSDDRAVGIAAPQAKKPAPAPVPQETPTGVMRIAVDVAGSPAPIGAVAVIDTGSGPHPDLNIAGGKNCSTGRSFNDGNGHGTHVAGTIAAIDNSEGVVGVLPGAPIYSVRVLNNAGSGTFSSVICGIDWVTANAAALGINVANMSLGGSGTDDGNCGQTNSDALHFALCGSVAAGVTYVVAAGNSGADLKDSVPAAYDEALSVSAVADFDGQPGGLGSPTCRADVDDTAADFSNFATEAADQEHVIAAPGVCIKSTWKGGGYNTISGTSMASPHVAGVVARCISGGQCAGLDPSAIAAKLRADAAAQDPSYGFTDDPRSPNGARYYGYLVKSY